MVTSCYGNGFDKSDSKGGVQTNNFISDSKRFIYRSIQITCVNSLQLGVKGEVSLKCG